MTHCLALSSLFLQGNGMNEVGSPICSYFHKAGKFMKVMDKHNSFEQLSFPNQFFGDAGPSTLTCEYEAKFGKKGHSQHDSACTSSQLYDLSPAQISAYKFQNLSQSPLTNCGVWKKLWYLTQTPQFDSIRFTS